MGSVARNSDVAERISDVFLMGSSYRLHNSCLNCQGIYYSYTLHMERRIRLTRFIVLFLLFAMCWILASISVDPDFGWRVQIGKYILHHGIPAVDPYSYTMPSFRFVDHEWLTHVVIYSVYTIGGYKILAILIAGVYTATVALITRQFRGYWLISHILLVAMVLLHYFAVKPQVLAWLYTALLINALISARWKYIYRYQIPFLFLLWANTHASFVYGLGVYAIWVATDYKKTKSKSEVLVFLVSVAVSFINPYTWRIWEEIIRTGSDTRLRLYVQEWMPQFLHIGLSSFILTGWYLALLIHYRRQMSLFEKLVSLTGFIFGISSSRNFPLWVITVSPIVARLFGLFEQEAGRNKITRIRMKKLAFAFMAVCFAITAFEVFFIAKEDISYSEKQRYPQGAIHYLQTHPTRERVFTAYEWGGYFIWKYPEEKVFIDGRMPSWRQTNAPSGESTDALTEYMKVITADKNAPQILNKYHIQIAVLPVGFLQDNKYSSFKGQRFINLLKKRGMKQVYKDNIAVVFSL